MGPLVPEASMTLRLRLVLAIGGLVLVGLGLFGTTTYSLYARSQHQRLDDQLRNFTPLLSRQLNEAAGLRIAPLSGGAANPGGGGPRGPAPIDTYAELRNEAGVQMTHVQLSGSTSVPRLPSVVTAEPGTHRFLTTGSARGSGDWRVYVTTDFASPGHTVVVAVPMAEVTNALHRLILIEASAAAGLLAILCAGSWFILGNGLRPLERMAGTAGQIAAGDLTQRVSVSSSGSEVGQLGVAFNTMLDEIEAAFAERDATEGRLRQFLADASHELRTPLTSIQGFAELFRMGSSADHIDLATILRRIEQESARMKVLVEDLLLLARLDQTRPADRQPVDLAVLAADACSDAVASAPDRPVTLDAPEPVVVLGDQSHLRQAIANLVANAVSHTPDATPVEVTAVMGEAEATVAVRDHGAGLDDEALAHAFDRFWQADKARVGSGTGLGLSIVAGIA
ncbi:MAG TPA: HAMP domain-containing sensor histidine kinase, partial [Acidimicrobiales bacterium]|nr:HAMP domain-containing sensor histidine kinase [Acidimicrobiales bacterium]